MIWNFEKISIFAIFLASVVRLVIGMIWYSPGVFGRRWLELKEMKPGDLKNKNLSILWGFLNALVLSFILAGFISLMDEVYWWTGAWVGFWAWLGFYATGSMIAVIWEDLPWPLYFLYNAETLLSYVIAGVILGAV